MLQVAPGSLAGSAGPSMFPLSMFDRQTLQGAYCLGLKSEMKTWRDRQHPAVTNVCAVNLQHSDSNKRSPYDFLISFY